MRALGKGGVLFLLTLTLAACGVGTVGHGFRHISKDSVLIIGTTDHVTTLDPAGSYENGSFTIYGQVYAFLMNFDYGANTPKPDAAQSCDFERSDLYRCILRPNLTFANGHPLTSRSVKFSFDRIKRINDPQGPRTLIENIGEIDTPDNRTVDFHLKIPNDQTIPPILAMNPSPILDERVFPADRILGDDEIVAGAPFGGPYTIDTYHKNELVHLTQRKDYQGMYGKVASENVIFQYYANAGNLKLDLLKHHVDVAFHSLSTTDYDELARTPGMKVIRGGGGETRSLAFNRKSQPGETEEEKLAVRRAIAASIDRQALARDIYHNQFEPAWSVVPEGTYGSVPAFREFYGVKPDKNKATQFLKDAGVSIPVNVRIQYTLGHYGPSSSEEYALIKSQLEKTGLFEVNLQSTEWVVYNKEFVAGSYPVFQTGWFPDFPDADTYLSPFFTDSNYLNNGFTSPVMVDLIKEELGASDPQERLALLAQAQRYAAQNFVTLIPLLSGYQLIATTDHVIGQQQAIGGAYKLRVGALKTSGGGAQ